MHQSALIHLSKLRLSLDSAIHKAPKKTLGACNYFGSSSKTSSVALNAACKTPPFKPD
jgi:hypothetical protein